MEQIAYIKPDTYEFYKTEGGFLGLKTEEKDHGRVGVLRSFPLSYESLYLSVRDQEQNEIGMIADLKDFEGEQQSLITEELGRRYFLPAIERIYHVKQEFGYYYWNVETDRGAKEFMVRKESSQILQLPGNRVIVIDVDGNRYEIKNHEKLDSKSLKQIELIL